MPSGSKKRKSSKKPRPSSQGEPPELEEGMTKDGEETGEGLPSPKATEGDPEAMGEGGLVAKEINGQVLQEWHVEPEEIKESSLTEEPFAPPRQEENCNSDDPPSQANPEPDIWVVIEGDAPARTEREREAPIEINPLLQIKSEIDMPIILRETATDAEIKREMEMDTAPTVFEDDTDAAPDAPADEFNPEANIGQDEIELSIESAPVGREPESSAHPIISESRMDESPVETYVAPTVFEGDTDAAPDAPADEFRPEADIGQDEIDLSIESGPVERESEPIAPPVVSEARMDGSPVESATANIEPVINKAAIEMEAGIDAAPAEVEPEIDEATAEMKPETDALPALPFDLIPETDVALADSSPEMEEALVEREAQMADIEPETDALPALPLDLIPETHVTLADSSPEMEEALVEREAEIADVEPETDAAPAGSELETDIAEVETDAFPVEVQPEIDAAETDLLEMEPETEAIPSAIKPEVNAAPIDTEQDEVEQAEIELEPQSEVEALPEVQAEEEVESRDTSLEIEAEMEPLQEIKQEPKPEPEPEPEPEEPPQEIEPEPKSEPEEPPQEIESEAKPEPEDPSEDSSLEIEAKTEPLQEIEPEPEVEAVDEAKPDELAEVKAEDKTSAEAELGQQDLVEGEVAASLETNPEPEVGASHEIEPEPEAEVSLDAEKKPEMEALAEAKSGEKGSFETESDQWDLVEIELEQTDVQEHDQQEHIVDAPEVPVIEDEFGDQVEPDEAILVDDSIPVIEASIYTDNEGPCNEQEFLGKLDEAEDISPSAVLLRGEGESTEEGVSDDQDPGADLEQDRETTVEGEGAVDNEQGVLDELGDESKKDIDEQERAGGDGPDDDLASAGDGIETLVPCEQEIGIELPLADAIDVDECATEGALLNDQKLVTEQPQLSIDEPELLGAADGPPSAHTELVEQGLKAILPSSQSGMTLDPYEPKDEAITSADEEKVAFEREFNLESSSELDRDIEEEEAASSTVAEAGSVLNDIDENVHYEHDLHTDFPSSILVPDSRDCDDTLSPKAPELVEAGLEEQLDSEPYPTKQQRFITESNGNEVKLLASGGDSLTDGVYSKVGQGLGNPYEQGEVLLESADVDEAAEAIHASFVQEVRDDVQPLSSPWPEQVVQDNEEDKVHMSKEGLAANKLKLVEEERVASEDGEGASTSILGVDSAKDFLTIAKNELMSKGLTTEIDGQYCLSRSEAPSSDLLDLRDKSSINYSEVNNMDEVEIHAVEAKELKGAELDLVGGDSSNEATVQSVSKDPEQKDIGVKAFRQESTQEASLPVVVPAQDRALEHVNLTTRGGAILEGRKKWLGCCGMFDVLLGKN